MTEYAALKVGDKLDTGLDWTTWLGTDTLASSTWAVSPATGLTLSDDSNTTTKTAVWGEVIEPGTYRLTNSIVTTAGRESSDDVVISVEADTLAGSYLTASEAEARLWGRYRIEADLTPGDLEAASSDLDAMPLAGYRADTDQPLAFPRDVTLPGDTAGEVPERVLDWVALRAYQLLTDEEPPTISESVGGVSVTYARPKISQTESRMRRLLAPYRAVVRIL